MCSGKANLLLTDSSEVVVSEYLPLRSVRLVAPPSENVSCYLSFARKLSRVYAHGPKHLHSIFVSHLAWLHSLSTLPWLRIASTLMSLSLLSLSLSPFFSVPSPLLPHPPERYRETPLELESAFTDVVSTVGDDPLVRKR